MRNVFSILILFFDFSINCIGQEIAIEKEIDTNVLNDYELTDKQYSAWKSIKYSWLASDYELIKSENKIKLNCKDCSAFYVEVVIKINESGKMEYYKLINGKRCGLGFTKELELRVMRKFFKFEYPFELRNTTFKTRLGDVLKC